MTHYLPDNSAVSETPWGGVLFAATNAGAARGIFGRRPNEMGSMTRRDIRTTTSTEFGAKYAFDHAGFNFGATVQTYFGGAQLRIHSWLLSKDTHHSTEALGGSRLKHGFDVIASGWIKREHGFYLLSPPSEPEFQARQHLRPILKACRVVVPDFYVRPEAFGGAKRRDHA